MPSPASRGQSQGAFMVSMRQALADEAILTDNLERQLVRKPWLGACILRVCLPVCRLHREPQAAERTIHA